MRVLKRVGRFGVIGIIATGIHGFTLLSLSRLLLIPTGIANLSAFIVAFIFSMSAQQAFTFNDRLAGQSLKKRSITILFLINAFLAYALGTQIHGLWIIGLAFVPPVINFTLLHFFTGHPHFKR